MTIKGKKDAVAIIGTRHPDQYQSLLAGQMAAKLSGELGLHIHTGAAAGTDEIAMIHTKEGFLRVYLPWATYNAEIIPAHAQVIVYDPFIHTEWGRSVAMFHPAAHRLTQGAFKLHARNYGIIRPVMAVLAFPNEAGEGGTGQGIRIAKHFNIPLLQCNKYAATPPSLKFMMRFVLDLVDRREGAV